MSKITAADIASVLNRVRRERIILNPILLSRISHHSTAPEARKNVAHGANRGKTVLDVGSPVRGETENSTTR
jgi:hypothetical protein